MVRGCRWVLRRVFRRFEAGGSGEDAEESAHSLFYHVGAPTRAPFSFRIALVRPWHIDVYMRALGTFHLQRDSLFLNRGRRHNGTSGLRSRVH